MKKIIFCGLLAAGCCLSATSQSKLSPHAQLMLLEQKDAVKARSQAAVVESVAAIVTLGDGQDASILKEKGLEVIYTAGNISIVSLPLARVAEIEAMPQVESIAFGEKSGMMMDMGRAASGVDDAHNGVKDRNNNELSYTGRGVICGMYDMGVDPNHAAFRNADGSTRVKAVFVSHQSGGIDEYTTPEQIANFKTDKTDESHGTHVAGIMAGSRNVQGRYAKANGATSIREEGDIPYYGVAYNSDLVLGCGDFYDGAIMAGVAKVVNHAKELGQPAVVNLSLGNNSGSHDPNSSTSKLLDELGKDAIILIAAGNEGGSPMAIQKSFSVKGGLTLNTFMTASKNESARIDYTAEFWSGDNTEFECELVLYNKLDNKVVSSRKVSRGTTTITPSDWPEFGEIYSSSSSIRVSCDVDKATNRFYVVLGNSMQFKNGASFTLFGVNITGKSQKKCFAYVNAGYNPVQDVYFTDQNVEGYIGGTDDGSINGFGCGHNFISVGSYTTRTSAPFIGNGNYTGQGPIGAISSFSSYGTLADGRPLPHVCAPGAQIVSSVSQYWYESTKKTADGVNALSTSHNHTSAYYPMQGTSMATPFAAGVVALWLEADPTLGVAEVLDLISKSSVKDSQTSGADLKRWGAGKINALRGLHILLGTPGGIDQAVADNYEKNFMLEHTGAKQFNVYQPGADALGVTLYNLQGVAVLSADASGDMASVNATSLQDGIYLLTVESDFGKITRKVALK